MSEINVNGVMYLIEYITDNQMKSLDGCDEFTMGNIDYHKAIISIKDDLQHSQKRKTLIHEIAHAIRFEYGLPREKNEETICEFVAAFYDEITKLLVGER